MLGLQAIALLMRFVPATVLPKLPKLEIPEWAWAALIVILAFAGYHIAMERLYRTRAKAASQVRENQRKAREIQMREEMEQRNDAIFRGRPSAGGAGGVLRAHAL